MEVYCVGEALIDFVAVEDGKALGEVRVFEKHIGGAPLNVAVGLSRLGINVGFVGKVGDDPFGRCIISFLRAQGVETDLVVCDRERKTRLAFVSFLKRGEREFEFWERCPADENLKKEEIPLPPLRRACLVHFGSLPLVSEGSRAVMLWLKESLSSAGPLLSFDVNYRSRLWKNEREARVVLKEFAKSMDIVKLSREELQLFCGGDDLVDCVHRVRKELEIKLLAITVGDCGCVIGTDKGIFEVEAFREEVVDTTGCGDAYMAAVICYVLRKGWKNSLASGFELGKFANAAGAICLTSRGATEGLPTLDKLLCYSGVKF